MPPHPVRSIMAAALLMAGAAAAHTAQAQQGQPDLSSPGSAPATPRAADEPALADRLWALPVLHRDADSAGLNELRIVGRLHVNGYVVDADVGEASDIAIRRARLGMKARLFRKLQLSVEADLDLEGGPLYAGLTEALVAYEFDEAAKLTLGKQSAKFTLDGSTSSNDLPTIERSALANNFWFTEEYAPGVTLGGRAGRWSYTAGVYSGGSAGKEFGGLDAGVFWLASAGHDFADLLGAEKALLRADFVHNEPDPDSGFTRPYDHVASLVFILDQGGWGVSADATVADGFPGQSDGFGLQVQPWMHLTDRLQFATRYTFLESEQANGLRLGRYENAVGTGRGDRYHEIYGGLNYLIHGNRLKLQTGLTYAHMRDAANDGGAYDGLSWGTALRLSW